MHAWLSLAPLKELDSSAHAMMQALTGQHLQAVVGVSLVALLVVGDVCH